jgi:hypothetical protein
MIDPVTLRDLHLQVLALNQELLRVLPTSSEDQGVPLTFASAHLSQAALMLESAVARTPAE